MKNTQWLPFFVLFFILTLSLRSFAGQEPLSLSIIKVKPKAHWTEVTIALENNRSKNLNLKCCTIFLENSGGYAVPALTKDEVQTQIHNSVKNAALIGSIIGAGLGIGGAVSGKDELVYAGIATAGTGIIAGAVGEAAAEKQQRDLVIDDISRNQIFPPGLKVAGTVFFPPRKKWPGSAKAKSLHLTYSLNGKEYQLVTPLK